MRIWLHCLSLFSSLLLVVVIQVHFSLSEGNNMSIAHAESISLLSSDIFYDILRRLDGASLASAACVCAAFNSISKEERIWENVCLSVWPSTKRDDVRHLISSIGGFRKFYACCYPLIVNKDLDLSSCHTYLEYPEEWAEAEYYDAVEDNESVSTSDFVSIVDIKYKDDSIFSDTLWYIPDSDGPNSWFYNSPFRVDVVGNSHVNVNASKVLSVNDGLPQVPSIDSEKKDGKLWKELLDGIRLSWIVVNRKAKEAANVSSWIPLSIQRHWPREKDFLIRFGSVLPAKDILPCQLVECIILLKFTMVKDAESGCLSLKLMQLSMQLEDVEGAHVNGRNSLMVLKEALSCRRSKDYTKVLNSCNLYTRLQSDLKEEKLRNESRIDRLCILSGIAAFITFWYCIL